MTSFVAEVDAPDHLGCTFKGDWSCHGGTPFRSGQVVRTPENSGFPPIYNEVSSIASSDSGITARTENETPSLARLRVVLAEIGGTVLRTDHSGRVLDAALALVAQALGVEYCAVLKLLPDEKTLLLRSGVGWRQGLVGHRTIGPGTDSQAGYTLLSNQAVVVEDLTTETRFSGKALLREHDVVSGVTVIIHTSEGAYGVLGDDGNDLDPGGGQEFGDVQFRPFECQVELPRYAKGGFEDRYWRGYRVCGAVDRGCQGRGVRFVGKN